MTINSGQLKTAAETLQRECNRLQGLNNTAQVLGDLAQLTHMAEEAQRNVDSIGQRTGVARAELAKVEKAVQEAQSDRRRIIEEAKKAGLKERADQVAEGAKLYREAEEQAANINAEVDREIAAKRDKANRELAAINEKKTLLTGECDSLDEQLANKKPELAELDARLTKTRQRMREMLTSANGGD